METLIHTMETGVAVAVSNGSFSQDMGAAAWTIEGETSAGRLVASSLAPGQQGDHSTFWSKLAGIYGISIMLKHFLSNYMNLTRSLTIVCHEKLAVDRLNLLHELITPTEAHHDLLGAIQSTMRDIPIKITM